MLVCVPNFTLDLWAAAQLLIVHFCPACTASQWPVRLATLSPRPKPQDFGASQGQRALTLHVCRDDVVNCQSGRVLLLTPCSNAPAVGK